MELQAIVQNLCAQVPRAIGAVVCDWEGEAIACAIGRGDAPKGAEARAREHVPRAITLTMPVSEFLVRLAAAEPAGLLRTFEESGARFGTGGLTSMQVSYAEISVLIDRLPNDFYLMLLLRRPAITAAAKRHMDEARRLLAEHVS
jgi:predicted regulator of Ras-like GTPase activity (Roadblock/LC7/MglB family)